MQKYIRTYYKNKKVIVNLSSCNKCPLLSLDFNNKNCKCRYFSSEDGNNIIKNNIYIYDIDKYSLYEFINIPKWCELPNNLSDLIHKFYYTFKVYENSLSINTMDFDALNLDTLYYNYDMKGFIHSYNDIRTDNNTITTDIKKYNQGLVCSLCGEEDTSVNRSVNFGMCDTCWELSQNNDYNKRLSYLNNFRLKRNKKIKSTIKVLKDIKI